MITAGIPFFVAAFVGATAPCLAAAAPPEPGAQPLTLDKAIARALASHPDLLAADTRVRNAQIGVDDAQSQRLQLTADISSLGRHAQAGVMDTQQAPSTSSDQAIANGTLALTVPLFTGFRITRAIDAANSTRSAAELQREADRADLTFQVIRGYWTMQRQILLEGVMASAIAQTRKTLALSEANQKLGRITALDVDRARVQVLNAEGDGLRAVGQTREARAGLASLLGLAPEAVTLVPVLDTEQPPAPLPARDTSGVPDTHPRRRAAEARVAAAAATSGVAGSGRWPQLALTSSYQYGNNPFNPALGASGVTPSLSGTWDVRLGLQYNLFDLGRVNRAVARADGDLALARAAAEAARRDVRNRLDLAASRAQNAGDRRVLAAQSGRLAQRALAWAEARFQQGYASQIEVIESRRSLLTARTQLVEALIDDRIARAELQLALGEL